MTDLSKQEAPEEFIKVIRDFTIDIKNTFPEYSSIINKWWKFKENYDHIEDEKERNDLFLKAEQKCSKKLFEFCKKKMPPKFFDILYQNEAIFGEDSDADTEFLPQIHFKNLWQSDLTEKTRETIWKYLQLILFSIIGTVENKEDFGDTAKLFEAINEDEFKNKLEETLNHIQGLFNSHSDKSEDDENNCNSDGNGNGLNENLGEGFNMPNANEIHEHITGMLDGKLGALAREIAEETASELNLDMENTGDMKDIFNKLIKNPTKLMGLVKTVGNKLDTKLKSGEIKESEMIAEATEIMNKMKNMPGMGNMQSMLNKMGMGNLAGMGGKMNMSGMESQLNKRMKMAQQKERMRAKMEANQKNRAEQQSANLPQTNSLKDEELIKLFSSSEAVERTPRGAKPQQPVQTENKKNKKKK